MSSIDERNSTETIAKHYNSLQESGVQERTKSCIFYMRNFNNWTKSMAIADVLKRVKHWKENELDRSITVLDMASGKGGDLLKWQKGNIDRLVCADIAATSVRQSEDRYKELSERVKNERSQLFEAEFITADCTEQRLKDMYKQPDIKFDLVSCQFALHYGFESLPQADMMLQNACECLKPGGFFIGTIPNAYELIKRLRTAEGMEFGNEVHKISFEGSDKHNLPLFGAKYHFMLEGVVDCPEFLVYFPLLQKLVEKYNLKLIYRKSFADFFLENIKTSEGRSLIGRMQGLEPYPADQDINLTGQKSSYSYVKEFYERANSKQNDEASDERSNQHYRGNSRDRKPPKVGTLSQPEWEAATVYLVFAFQRCEEGEMKSAGVGNNTSFTRKRNHDQVGE